MARGWQKAGFRLAVATALATAMVGSAGAYVPGDSVAPSSVAKAATSAARFEGLLAQLQVKEKALVTELEQIKKTLATLEGRLIVRGRAYYRLVRAGLLPVGGGFDSLVDHAASVERLRAALGRDIDRKRQLMAREQQATQQLLRVRAERAPLEVQRQAMQSAHVAMRQAEERKVAFMRAFGRSEFSAPAASSGRTVYGADNRTSNGFGVRFSELRGRLSLPLSGRAEVVVPRDPKLRGTLRLLAATDSPARAVHTGRVVFVGKSQFGDAVVIDHGERYFTVYANLQRVEVKVGETVPEHARLGWVMRTGGDRPWLHFEIRRGKRLVDASPWLGL